MVSSIREIQRRKQMKKFFMAVFLVIGTGWILMVTK